jgi:hypothetical protein
MLPLVLFMMLFTGALQAVAQENNHSDHGNPQRAEVPAPPAMSDTPEPPHAYDDEEDIEGRKQVQADVTITREKDRTIEEYRINGQLYMVKITPTKGKPYYLLYKNGEHNSPMRRELDDIQTPYWKLFEW